MEGGVTDSGKPSKSFKWQRISKHEDLIEGEFVWLQSKDGPDVTVGYITLKDEWCFLLQGKPTLYTMVHWYVSTLVEEKEKEIDGN